MASHSGPKLSVETDNLVLALDAANTKSYPSSGGTTWYDLSVEGNDGTIDSATHNSDGYFTFDGTCLLYTSPSPRDLSTSRMPSSA